MSNILEVKDVHKHLGKREIIKGISFSVEEGEVFGFLGPNGAGKTTTIRMLVGLIAPNKGMIAINGYDIKSHREKALEAVGAVVENPELYTYLSGRENLMQIARIRNINKKDVDEAIELVGLSDRIGDKVKKYSLGMKQRLGLAAALMSKPKLLILDEPTNGLDPSGIIDFRNIVKSTAKERNTAVFVSSHILSEVQQLCDKVAFIDKGVIKSIESINGNIENNEFDMAEFLISEIDKAYSIVNELSYVTDIIKTEQSLLITSQKSTIPDVIFALSDGKVRIEEVAKKHRGLEDRYMELVQGGKKDV